MLAPRTERPKRLLFVCEYNSCRSQLAEAVARALAPEGWQVSSAGLQRTVVSDEVVRALTEAGFDSSGLSSKSLDDVADQTFDEIVVLAAPAVDAVRSRFGSGRLVEWLMDDPLRVGGGIEAVRQAVRWARDELRRRLATRFGGDQR